MKPASPSPRPPKTQVIAVGASLGGLAALRSLLEHLPEALPAALVLVQHRAEEAESLLPRLLARHTNAPVREPYDRDSIDPGVVYVAPAGYHLLTDGRCFALSVDGPTCYARPSVDVLFESVADSFGNCAAGVILTGSSVDGAAGAKAIKDAGGRLAVQDPKLAESPVSILATLASTNADFVGSTAEIAECLGRWCGARFSTPHP